MLLNEDHSCICSQGYDLIMEEKEMKEEGCISKHKRKDASIANRVFSFTWVIAIAVAVLPTRGILWRRATYSDPLPPIKSMLSRCF
jgi:hypothetical protein